MEYFTKFLPTAQSGIKKDNRYICIKQHLLDPMSKIYIAFMTHNAQDFENFLGIFQDEKPMIHCLYHGFEDLYRGLLQKFNSKKHLEITKTKIPLATITNYSK